MEPPRNTKKASALLVDDDASTSPLYMRRLQAEGYQVTKATDSAIALGLANQSPPAIIFVHLGRRGSGSSAFIHALRSKDETRHIPVALLSNYFQGPLERMGLSAVGQDF